MRYHELLSQLIDNSGLTLGEITLRLAKKNIKISKSYISKLKNGLKPPASEEINIALAEITNGDVDELVKLAYLEKAPESFKKELALVYEFINQNPNILKEYPSENPILKNEKNMELYELISRLNENQKEAIINMVRSLIEKK